MKFVDITNDLERSEEEIKDFMETLIIKNEIENFENVLESADSDKINYNKLFLIAIRRNKMNFLNQLIDNIDIGYDDNIFIKEASKRSRYLVDYLIKHGAKTNNQNFINYLVANENYELIKYLIKEGKVDSRKVDFSTKPDTKRYERDPKQDIDLLSPRSKTYLISDKYEQKSQNITEEYFNIVAEELDIYEDEDYLLGMEKNEYNKIKIRDLNTNENHYEYTFKPNEIIYQGQGEYIIYSKKSNLTKNQYFKNFNIVKQLNPLINNNVKLDLEEIENIRFQLGQDVDMFFIPRVLYELFYIQQYINNSCIDGNIIEKECWYYEADNQKDAEILINDVMYNLNNLIYKELKGGFKSYKQLYDKFDHILNNIYGKSFFETDNPEDISGISEESHLELVIKVFKLECSPLAKLGYIIYRGAFMSKDSLIDRDGYLKSLSFGVSLFASFINDIVAMAYNFMVYEDSGDAYCIIIPFDQINGNVFVIPPLTTIEQLFSGGVLFHVRTRTYKPYLLEKKLHLSKYTSYRNERLPQIIPKLSPEDLNEEFLQYKKTAIKLL